jgi:hypothetical protein
MSIISTAYDAMIARLGTLYPSGSGWVRLPNPYKPEENNELYLKQGYGIALGSGENTNRVVNCKFSINRTMTIVITRKFYAREDDASAKATTEKQLFEDQYELINDLEQDFTVNDSTMYTRYISDGGIEYISGEKDNFLMLRTEFSVEYLETFV